MPTFDFTSPDGKTYSVNGPDGATPEQAFQMLQQHLSANTLPQIGVGEDVAKSVGGGLVSSAAGLASTLPAISSVAHTAANKYLFDPLFNAISGPPKQAAQQPPDINQAALGAINSAAAPYDYQPQTTAGKLAKTGSEFATMMGGGPESLLTKALTRVAAPTLATEGAGVLTEGTAAEPYARIAGAVLGGAGAGKVANTIAERQAVKAAAPSLDTLKSGTSAGYDALTAGNVATPLAAGKLESIANDLRDTLNRKGIRPSNAAGIHSAVNEIATPATAGAPDVADLVAARQSIKNLLGDPSTNKAGAFIALNKLDKEIEAASPGTMSRLKELDQNYAAVKANEALDKKVARAELRATGEHSGLNVGNKIKQKVSDLLLSNQAKYLSADTKAELEKVVNGTVTQRGMRLVSNLLGGGGGLGSTLLGSGAALGGEYTGHPELALLPVAGVGTRMAYNRAVKNAAARAAQNIRLNSPMGQQRLSPTIASNLAPGLTMPNPGYIAMPQTTNPIIAGLLGLLPASEQLRKPNAAP